MCMQGWTQMTRCPTWASALAMSGAVRGATGKVECGGNSPVPPQVLSHCIANFSTDLGDKVRKRLDWRAKNPGIFQAEDIVR